MTTTCRYRCDNFVNMALPLPKDLAKIIRLYLSDIHLLESMPFPRDRSFIRPLNLVVFGIFTLAELIIFEISNTILTEDNAFGGMLQIGLADIIEIPINMIATFQHACEIYDRRRLIWGLPANVLPPGWDHTMPFIILDFVLTGNRVAMIERVNNWLLLNQSFPYLM